MNGGDFIRLILNGMNVGNAPLSSERVEEIRRKWLEMWPEHVNYFGEQMKHLENEYIDGFKDLVGAIPPDAAEDIIDLAQARGAYLGGIGAVGLGNSVLDMPEGSQW